MAAGQGVRGLRRTDDHSPFTACPLLHSGVPCLCMQQVFAQVSMLYVEMCVNGVPVKAFVDSGAQMTIMTAEFAARCYLTRLIDKRYKGIARGVGSSEIIGRIHQASAMPAAHSAHLAAPCIEHTACHTADPVGVHACYMCVQAVS